MNRITLSIIAGLVILGTSALIAKGNLADKEEIVSSVSTIVDGKQIVEINAKGGYSPRITSAKADIPTILRVNTRATFDCSSAITIPSIGYRATLPPSGVTEIEIPPQKAGSTLQGLCSMGMYNFQIRFN